MKNLLLKRHRHKPNKAGLPPETAVYTGHAQVEEPVVVVVEYNDALFDEKILRGLDCLPPATDKVTWYDVRGLNQVPLIEQIGQTFNMHPLAVEDVLNTTQRPKWDDYRNGIFITLRALRFDEQGENFITEQISFFLEKNALLTFQEDVHDLFEVVRERLKLGRGKVRQSGADFLVYILIDCIVDDYINILDHLEETIETTEIQILTNFTPSVRSHIYKHKRQLSEIRRAVLPLRDVISRFSREQGEFVNAGTQVYIRDLYDHVVRVIETVENQRDMLNNLNDLYNSES